MRTSVFIYGLATLGGITLLSGLAYGTWQFFDFWNGQPEFQTVTVTEGDVIRSIALSGISSNRARTDLTFPVNGTLQNIVVAEGEEVSGGQLLATLTPRGEDDEVRLAKAALQEAIAAQRELLSGPTDTSRQVLETTVTNAQIVFEQVTREQEQAVKNAWRTLLNSTITAFPVNTEERTPAPIISGTYECETAGAYTFTVFRSNAESGFSIRISGLEEDTIPLSFTQDVPFGTCGLRVRFNENPHYNRTEWRIPLPNTSAPNYNSNRNAYESALTTRDNRLEAAEAELQLAKQQRDRDIAPTRSEQIDQANARIAQAESHLSQARRNQSDTQLFAPDNGIVTTIHKVIGESTSGSPVITMARNETIYTIDVRIPEIDIADVKVDQTASVVFDARSNETYPGVVTRISPLPSEIDGVSYFTASIMLEKQPPFMRSGLNADVDIIVASERNVSTLPITAIANTSNEPFVRVLSGDKYREQPVSILLRGTDGLVAITGIDIGTEVIINR